ncbi:hypothetical protein M8494_35765 [Serratia ureilytica]
MVSPPPSATLGRFSDDDGAALRELRSHAGYRLRQLAADRGVGQCLALYISPFINVQLFDAPGLPAAAAPAAYWPAVRATVLILTYRGRTDARDLQVDIDIYLEQFPTEDVLDMARRCKSFCCALQREAWEQPLAALDGVACLIKCGWGCPRPSSMASIGQQCRHFARVLAWQERTLTSRVPKASLRRSPPVCYAAIFSPMVINAVSSPIPGVALRRSPASK